jgi:hypothetical protein
MRHRHAVCCRELGARHLLIYYLTRQRAIGDSRSQFCATFRGMTRAGAAALAA